MPIPRFIHVPSLSDDSIRWSDDDDDENTSIAVSKSGFRCHDSCNSLHTSWSRWDSSDGGICEMHGSHNFVWEVPRPAAKGLNRLLFEANIGIDGHDVPSHKLSVSRPLLTKSRSLSPGPPTKTKLRSCPPRLRRESPRCGCGPPKVPVRKGSAAPSSSSECASACDCGTDHFLFDVRQTSKSPGVTA